LGGTFTVLIILNKIAMKSLKVILGTFLACTMLAFSSGEKVPQKVKEAFAKKFPMAKKIKWDKENSTEWEVEFKMHKVAYSANFLENGTWKETEHKIKVKEIPNVVKTALMTAFPGYDIEAAEISETQEGKVYEIEIEKGETKMEVVLDPSGTIVKKEVLKENDKENDKEDNN